VSEPGDAAKVAVGLLRNGLRYRCLRMAARAGRPQAVSLEVTHACVCRCLMCNIWKIPSSVPDLALEEWATLLSNDALHDLRELDITGGEPFLRDDLAALIEAVCELKDTHLRRLRSVAITTNGVLTDRVLAMVREMLEPMARHGLELVVVCALDAVGEAHDRIRRYPGAWLQADRTIAGLLGLRLPNPHLIVGLKTTVLPQNVGELEKIAQYARERGLFTIVSPAIVTPGRYLNPDKAVELTLSPADRERLAAFYEGPDFAWSFHARTLATFLRGGRVEKPCTCGYNYFFVRSNGDVFLCPLFEESVGNIRDVPLTTLLGSARARAVRRRVGAAPECARCTEPGLERYSLPYEGFTYLGTLLRKGPRAFLGQHRRLGLDKYV
jgi:MoaA/NifB/PqqE/SkfB family radical SAM enzyme